MVKYYPRLWQLVLVISIALSLLAVMWPSAAVSLFLAFGLILLIGIPHGAADHQLFQRLYLKHHSVGGLISFYLAYLGLMGLVILGWIWWPIFTLIAFLVMSAYHFGQGNFAYLPKGQLSKHLLELFWGAWVICAPICFHFTEARPIIETLVEVQLDQVTGLSVQWWPFLLLLPVLGLLFYQFLSSSVSTQEGITRTYLLRELITLAVLLVIFYFSPLLLGFAIYFALWHALPSALDQIAFLTQERGEYPIAKYLRIVAPLSGMAFLTIMLVWWLKPTFSTSEYWSWLFAFIAALTLPHMLILDRVYHQMNHLEESPGDS